MGSRHMPAVSFSVFPTVAADAKGGVYVASSWVNPATHRADLFFAASATVASTGANPCF